MTDLVETLLFLLSQGYGGHLGWAILSMGVVSRAVLLPLSLRVARRARLHGREQRRLRPLLQRLRATHAENPTRLAEETLALYRREGTSPVDSSVLVGSLLQAPVFMTVYRAVRRAVAASAGSALPWIRSLASPSLLVAVVAAVLVGVSAGAGADPMTGVRIWQIVLPVALTLVTLAFLPSWIGVYAVGAGLVGTLQGLLLRRMDHHDGGS